MKRTEKAPSKYLLGRTSVICLNNSVMQMLMKILWVSFLLDLWVTANASCPFRCQCFQNTKTVSCNSINSFPLPAVPNSLFDTVVISQSNLNFFENLELWENLKEVYFPQTWLNCDHFENVNIPHRIEFYWGINECNLPNLLTSSTTNLQTSSTIKTTDQTTNVHQTVSFSQKSTNFIKKYSTSTMSFTSEEINYISTTDLTDIKNPNISTESITFERKSKFNYWFILLSFNIFVVFAVVLALLIYHLKYKRIPRVNSIRSPLPTRSQLDLRHDFSRHDYFSNDCEEIELDSFDSSCNNIYETVRSPYENIP